MSVRSGLPKLFLLVFFPLIYSCSHPLEITGEGDIVSASGTRNCTLEEQPCENVVVHEYVETYTAIPRSGWTFTGWERCGEQHPQCSFNIAAEYVHDQWFNTMPSLVAVFVPASKLNDTGITWSGNYESGNNNECVAGTNGYDNFHTAQDCSHGRDADAAVGTLIKVGGGSGGFDFSKLDANGNSLPADATEWSCVRDNHTGLVWEVKTDDGGIHDKDNTYRWGGLGADSFGSTFYNDWNSLVNGANSEQLCGFSDWRVPYVNELIGILSIDRTAPNIDESYFPNTPSGPFWASSAHAYGQQYAWTVYFDSGASGLGGRDSFRSVRLVRIHK